MKKQQLITLLLIISLFFSYAQQSKIDSLRDVFLTQQKVDNKAAALFLIMKIKNKTDFKNSLSIRHEFLSFSLKNNRKKDIYEAYRYLSYYFLRNGLLDSVKFYDKKLYTVAKLLDSGKVVSVLQNMGAYYFKKSNPDSSLYYLNKAERIALKNLKSESKKDSIKRIQRILMVKTAITKSLFAKNDFDKALKNTYQTKELADKYNIHVYDLYTYYYLGMIHMELNKYTKAIEYYNKEYELSKEQKKINNEAFALLHLGKAYFISKINTNKAFDYFLKAKNIFDKQKYYSGEQAVRNNLFNYYEHFNNYNEAIKVGTNYANFYLKQQQLDYYLASFYIKLGRVFLLNGNLKKGNYYINSGLQFAIKHKSAKAVDIFNEAYITYKKLKNSKKALYYYEKTTFLRDSLLLNETFIQKLNEVETKYQTEKKEKENLKLKNEATKKNLLIAQQKQKTTTLLTSFIALAILFFSGIFYFKQRQKTQKQQAVIDKLQAKENERNRLAGNVHDSLAGDLRTAMIQVDTINKELKNDKLEDVVNVIERAYNKTRTISQEYQKLNFSKIPFEKYVKSLLFERQELYSIIIDQEGLSAIDWKIINPEIKTEFYRILQEAFINIHKHAKASHVMVYFNLTNNNIQMEIKDDGIGLDITKSFESVGLSNIQARIKDLNGKLKIVSTPSNGFELLITVPV